MALFILQTLYINSDVHANSYPHRGTRGGGWMEPLPGVFDMSQYFETIFPLVESL